MSFITMLIQGIGDEVISVLLALGLGAVISLLWLTTYVRERPPVRAVVIRSANSETIAEIPAAAVVTEPNRSSPQNELTEAVEATQESFEQVAAADGLESSEHEATNEDLATIKVRFINETSLEIRERLSEKLGRFISKHLDRHLNVSNEDRVRLIYNGRVLGREQTLAEHGLTDNCVVHCLVQRSFANSSAEATANEQNQGVMAEAGELDLSSYCFPLLGTILILIWCCEVAYEQYFTFTTTMSLVSLTVLFIVTAINTYII